MPYWEDTEPRLSPDGSTVAYADEGSVWVVAAAGGPPRKLAEAGSPVWLGNDRLVVSVEREDTLAARRARRRRCVAAAARAARTAELDALRRRVGRRRLARRRDASRSSSAPRTTCSRSEIRVVDVATGEVRALTGADRIARPGARLVARRRRRSPSPPSARGWYELHLVDADGSGERQLTAARRRLQRAALAARRRHGRAPSAAGATASTS